LVFSRNEAILGHEQNAADVFATPMLLKLEGGFSDRVLINAAKGWFLGERRE